MQLARHTLSGQTDAVQAIRMYVHQCVMLIAFLYYGTSGPTPPPPDFRLLLLGDSCGPGAVPSLLAGLRP